MLTVKHIRHWFEPKLPHTVFLDGLYAGIIKEEPLSLEVPPGSYSVKVQFGGRVPLGKNGKSVDLSLSTTETVEIPRSDNVVCAFHDRERLWNILFDIDMVLWIVSLFVQMPTLYKILSDSFFALWLVRLILIRKKYYKIKVTRAS